VGATQLRIDAKALELNKTKQRAVTQGLRSYAEVFEAQSEALKELSSETVKTAISDAVESTEAALAEAATSPSEAGVRGVAQETADTVKDLLTDTSERFHLSAAAVREQANAMVGAVQALLSGREQVFASLIEALAEEHASSEDIDRLNAARRIALFNRVRSESYAGPELAEWGLQRQRLHQLREENRLFAIKIPQERSLLYPQWEFDETHREREGLPELIAEAKELGLDSLSFHLIMTNPEAGEGRTPLELWESGETGSAEAILKANAV
jgi:hypothetical protein